MLTHGSDEAAEDVPGHVAVVFGDNTEPSEVRDFYVWCDDLGVEKATVCLPRTANRELYNEAVEGLEPPVTVVEEGDAGHEGNGTGAPRLLSYIGGRDEIVEAFRGIARDVEDGRLDADEVDADAVEERLAVPVEPDLLIEPSEGTLSDVLVWQSVYSELCYVDELDRRSLRRCLEDYSERERRYGR